MRNKFLYLIKVSLKRKKDTKWFRIANILIALVIIGTANIDSIINYFGGDFNKPQKIYIIDNTNSSYDIFKQQIDMNESNKEYKFFRSAYNCNYYRKRRQDETYKYSVRMQ